MKKLLSILGAITLIGTTSTSVIACGGGEKPNPPAPDTRTDVNGKITSPIVLEKLDTNTASEFLIKLQEKLMTISGLSNIKTTDYDVYKANTINEKITDNDITTNTYLNIKIVASPTSKNFRGSKQNIIVNFQKKLESVFTDTDLGTINIPQSIIDDSDKSKIEWLILSYLKSNNKNKNLSTLGINVIDVQIDKQQNTGTAKVKSNNKNYYTGEVNISFVFSIEKIDLNQLKIDQYINTNADTSKKMKDLDISKILKIFDKIKLTSPTIEYQDSNGNNINENAQKAWYFWVKITADKKDNNYTGTIVDSGWKLNLKGQN